MKCYFSFMLVLAAATTLLAETVSLEEFMRRVRFTNPDTTYAALEGTLQHRRRDEADIKTDIYFATVLAPERLQGQLIVGGREGYLLGQTRNVGDAETTVIPMPGTDPNRSLLNETGLLASDLTTSFLFYPVLREYPAETLQTQRCRVILLQKPDKTETVKVFISEQYYFPLQAEFYRAGEDAPYRTLRVSGFKKLNGLYYADEITLFGPGWRTRINFNQSADVGEYDPVRNSGIIRPSL